MKTTNKNQSSYWKCRATITTINEMVVKINGIKREENLEKEVIDRIVRESHDGECHEINDIDLKAKLSMKQRASSTSDSIEKLYYEEQSKLLRQFSDLEVA